MLTAKDKAFGLFEYENLFIMLAATHLSIVVQRHSTLDHRLRFIKRFEYVKFEDTSTLKQVLDVSWTLLHVV